MKKFILLLCTSLLSVLLVNSYAYNANTETAVVSYCSYYGLHTKSPDIEYKMLLEPRETPNFVAMSNVVAILAITPDNILKDNSCKVNGYTVGLLHFYQNNKETIKNNDQDIATLLELIKNKMER